MAQKGSLSVSSNPELSQVKISLSTIQVAGNLVSFEHIVFVQYTVCMTGNQVFVHTGRRHSGGVRVPR